MNQNGQTNNDLQPTNLFTPSELILLNGGQFAPQASWLDSQIELLDGATKVSAPDLGRRMLAAAFLANEQHSAIRLETAQKKILFGLFKPTVLFTEAGEEPAAWPQPSLEAYLRRQVERGRQEAFNLVYDWLEQDTNNPWDKAAQLIKENLARRGLLEVVEEKKFMIFTTTHYLLPAQTAELIAQQPLKPLQTLLTTTEQERVEIWQHLLKQINKAIDRRTTRNDGGGGGE